MPKAQGTQMRVKRGIIAHLSDSENLRKKTHIITVPRIGKDMGAQGTFRPLEGTEIGFSPLD